MKKLLLIFFTFYIQFTFGQTSEETIKIANELVNKKKYETAFKLLDTKDPDNQNGKIVCVKVDILLDYFVSSIMHQMFSLKDLEENEEVQDYRGKDGSFGIQMFPIDSVLLNLIDLHPNNCELYNKLGYFYYEVYTKYGNNWLVEEAELLEFIETNYKKSIDMKCGDYMAYFSVGLANLVKEQTKESIPFFIKSIELNKEFATSHYNLAYAYLFTDQRKEAITYAKNATNLYSDKELKSDAARLVAVVYKELGDHKNAIEYYELSNRIDPENYYTVKPLLDSYLKTKNSKSKETTKLFFDIAPSNPTIYNDLEEMYYVHKKTKDLISFYKSQFAQYNGDNKVTGNLNFYLARIYLDSDKKQAKTHFLAAKDNFEKIFETSHPVFGAIQEGLEQTTK
jgi:tetratricopeptide (TPR) repeat protein